MTSYSDYYQDELKRLRNSSVAFAERYPLLAPALEAAANDPDVERLLEGTAFLTAGIVQQLDDDYPVFLNHLAQVICPELLRPVPAATIVQFTPRKGSAELVHIKRGTPLESEQVEDRSYRFTTCYDTDVWPLEIDNVDRGSAETMVSSVGGGQIRLSLHTMDIPLGTLPIERLRFYLGGDFAGACDLYYLLNHHVEAVKIRNSSGQEVSLAANAVAGVGFADGETLIPGNPRDLTVFTHIHDYFHFAEKFLFIEIDLQAWQQRSGDKFEIIMQLGQIPIPVPQLSRNRFILFATPAVNLFEAEAEPVLLTHQRADYALAIKGSNSETQIFAINQVSGLRRGIKNRRPYRSYANYVQEGGNNAVYHLKQHYLAAQGRMSIALCPTYPDRAPIEDGEILQVSVTATDGVAALVLQPGQINRHAMGTPQRVTFTNLTPPKGARPVADNSQLLWYLISHLSLQRASLTSGSVLASYLTHYAGLASHGSSGVDLAQRRIEGIAGITSGTAERFVRGRLFRGLDMRLQLRRDTFISSGDRYLFGRMVCELYQALAPINHYTLFAITDLDQEERIEWPMRLGTQTLI
ncbi:MAG: type VI secretion system baseplate subunit TssF [Gammaproteobacteria bacterium]|nr:type VI secretion system baseplate subunit TssF [Gammaproteobacteria bacterium]